MRILLDARYLDDTWSGIGTYSRQLIEHLSKVDKKNEYYILVSRKFSDMLEVGANFTILSYEARPISFKTMTNLGRFVDDLQVDLMHSLFPMAPLFERGPIGMKTPLIVTVHDLQPFIDPDFSGNRPPGLKWAYSLFYRFAYPATFARAKWIITVSYTARDTVQELFPNLAPKLIPVISGLDENLFDSSKRDPDEVTDQYGLNSPYLLYYGSTRPNKNIPMAIRGFANYIRSSEDTETELVMILKKDRFFHDIEKVMAAENIADRIRILDQVDVEDQKAITSQAIAFLFPTKYEGFGFPPLEAMARSIPVIAGESGALPEICADAAEYVDPDDPNDIARAISLLVNDRGRREQLVESGRERSRHFDWTEAAEKVRSIYQLLM